MKIKGYIIVSLFLLFFVVIFTFHGMMMIKSKEGCVKVIGEFKGKGSRYIEYVYFDNQKNCKSTR
jgi:hypothetical protein